VSEVFDPGGDLIQSALLQPAVDFGRLEQVFVMFHRGPTMELLYGDATSGDAGANTKGTKGIKDMTDETSNRAVSAPVPLAAEGQP